MEDGRAGSGKEDRSSTALLFHLVAALRSPFKSSVVSTIISFVGTVSLGSGLITPIIVGMNNPHGMAFLPQ